MFLLWPRERHQARHQAAQPARRRRATSIHDRAPSPFPPPPCSSVIPNHQPLRDVKMYKCVHYFENTPVYVRDDVLPYLLSISGPVFSTKCHGLIMDRDLDFDGCCVTCIIQTQVAFPKWLLYRSHTEQQPPLRLKHLLI